MGGSDAGDDAPPLDDPLYDPAADAAAAAWADARRPPAPGAPPGASLACAACFTPVCPRAQAHAARRGLYRSVYVADGVAPAASAPPVPVRSGSALGKRRAGEEDAAAAADEPPLPALVCGACGATVGAVDAGGVFIFFDVLPSDA
jgi:hypothetical protein